MEAQSVALIALSALSGLLTVGWLVRKKRAVDDWQKEMVEAANTLTKYGWERLAGVAVDLGVGDLSGAVQQLRSLSKELRDPERAVTVISTAALKALPTMMEDDGARTKVLALIEKWRRANPETVVKTQSVG